MYESPRPLSPLVLGLALLLGAVQSPADSVGLRLEPATTFAVPGDVVSLELFIDGLGDFVAPSLGDFDIDIAFDPLALGFIEYELGTFLGDFALFEAVDFSLGIVGSGVINVAVTSLLDPDDSQCGTLCSETFLNDIQPGSFLLSTLDFDVMHLPTGASTVVSMNEVNALGDGFGKPTLKVEYASEAVITNPAVVPLPGAVWLFFIGMASLGWIGCERERLSQRRTC